jgi:hypothetical protein
MIKKYIGTGFVALGLLFSVGFAAPAQASSLTSAQVSAIIGLLQSFGADQSVINSVQIALGGSSSSALSCSSFADLSYGNFDNNPGGRVSQLQTFLGISSRTFGFGTYGRKTQAAWNSMCGEQAAPSAQNNTAPTNTQTNTNTTTSTKSTLLPDTLKITYPSSDTAIAVGQKITISYSVGGNVVANDPSIVERKIVKAGTDTSVSGYIPVSVSGGVYTFDWTPSEAGTYQALLSISHNNTTYPARSAVITVGSGNTTSTNTNSTPSITYSYISSGNVIGSFTNLPANSQIRFVNASTGQRYDAQSTMVWSGGSGPLSITIPNDLPNGTYYLRATDYYNPNTTIAQSSSFQAGTTQVAPTATIDQSSLSTTSTHPRITGTAHGVNAVGLSIGKNGGKFDGTGTFNMDQYGNWGVTLNNQTYEPGTYQVDVYSDTNVLLISGTLTVTGNITPPTATLDQSSLSTSSNHPRITGTAHGVSSVGLSISQGGGKFDGTGFFSTDAYGNWGVTLNNQTYTPGTYGIDVYSDKNVLLMSGTLMVTSN